MDVLSAERTWQTSRRTMARALYLRNEAVEQGNERKAILFHDLAQAELEQAVITRGQVLREKFLESIA